MRLGVDLGGTKIEIVAIDDVGDERLRRRISTPRDDYDAIVRAIVDLVLAAEREVGPATVGVGTPGAISPATGLVKNANTTTLNGRPLHRDLEHALGREVRLANDANCLAVSEATDGAAAGARVVFAVILGTGVGGGIALEGRPIVGRNAIAGEWGHTPVPWPEGDERPGPPCYCGRSGCLETFLSGPGLAADHERVTGEQVSAVDLAHRADADDALARATIDRWLDRLARGLAIVIDVIDPDAIVLGGGLSNLQRTYLELPGRLQRHVFSDRCDTPIVPARWGDSSGVRGAAWLWPAR